MMKPNDWDSLRDPRTSAGLLLLVGQLMRRLGVREAVMDPNDIVDRSGRLTLEVDDQILTVKLNEGEE